jgi:hypothetical protein
VRVLTADLAVPGLSHAKGGGSWKGWFFKVTLHASEESQELFPFADLDNHDGPFAFVGQVS